MSRTDETKRLYAILLTERLNKMMPFRMEHGIDCIKVIQEHISIETVMKAPLSDLRFYYNHIVRREKEFETV